MENDVNKIILDINLDHLLNEENNDSVEVAKKDKYNFNRRNKKLGTIAETLLKSDFIPEKKLNNLKNECVIQNPVAVMEGRHKEAWRFNNYNNLDTSRNVDIVSEAKRSLRKERLQKLYRQHQIETIDRELNQLKKDITRHSVVMQNKSKTKEWEPDGLYGEQQPLFQNTRLTIRDSSPLNSLSRFNITKSNNCNDLNEYKESQFDRILMESVLNSNDVKNQVTKSDLNEVKVHPLIIENSKYPEEVNANIQYLYDASDENYIYDKKNNYKSSEVHSNVEANTIQPSTIQETKTEVLKTIQRETSEYFVQDIEHHDSEKQSTKLCKEIELQKPFECKAIDLVIDSVSLKPHNDICVTSKCTELSQENNHQQIKIDFQNELQNKLKLKAFSKWKSYCSRNVKNKHDEIEEQSNMVEKIDIFLKKLNERKKSLSKFSKSSELLKSSDLDFKMKKKKSTSAPLSTQYKNRFAVQQDMIVQQKARILEQERTIQQLQAKSLAVAAKESVKQACADYIDATRCNNKTKPKMRANVYLNIEVNRTTMLEEQNSAAEHFDPAAIALVSQPAPAFLQAMNFRAQQRQLRHQATQERRKQREEEIRLAKEREEQIKLEEDQQAKLLRIAERRRKREEEQEKQRCLEMERRRIKLCEQSADQHYKKVLLWRYGLMPLKKVVEIKRCDMLLSKEHYRHNLLKRIFAQWALNTDEITSNKAVRADNFNRSRQLQIWFKQWYQFHLEMQSKSFVAEDWYNLRILSRVIAAWNEATKKLIIERDKKCYIAQLHYERQLKWRSIDTWRLLPSLNEIERQRERRKNKWRNKVWEILPDYKPVIED